MWWELAERTRSLADGMIDPAERRATLAIVADYETAGQGCRDLRRFGFVFRCLSIPGVVRHEPPVRLARLW